MRMILHTCPVCQATMTLNAHLAGLTVKCSNCNSSIAVAEQPQWTDLPSPMEQPVKEQPCVFCNAQDATDQYISVTRKEISLPKGNWIARILLGWFVGWYRPVARAGFQIRCCASCKDRVRGLASRHTTVRFLLSVTLLTLGIAACYYWFRYLSTYRGPSEFLPLAGDVLAILVPLVIALFVPSVIAASWKRRKLRAFINCDCRASLDRGFRSANWNDILVGEEAFEDE